MDFDDDYCFSNTEEKDEVLYSDNGHDEEDYDFIHHASDNSDVSPSNRYQANYTVLSESDIRQLQEDEIMKISTVLSISKVAASILLRHHNWNVGKIHDEWFADEEKVRSAVGLLEKPLTEYEDSSEVTCGICFDSYPGVEMVDAGCGHPFCSSRWAGYISEAINGGPGCLSLRCPDPLCGAAVGQDVINLLASDEEKEKYSAYYIRPYVEDNKKAKWCPAPGCDFAVDFAFGSGSCDVTCNCSCSVCWNCTEEAHRPVDCDTVAKWILKNSAESENMIWILADSKPCPSCKRPIEKNQGCMHMTCTPPCKFEFCWLCLGPWSEHGETTGGCYACNRYEEVKTDKEFQEAEKQREIIKSSLERYYHYYERWAINQSSRQKALADLEQMQTVHLKFITEAWLQGYYIPEKEKAEIEFFECLQGEAEAGLERLHQCAEKELEVYLTEKNPERDFNFFRTKLSGLTSVTRTFFENLVKALENGLPDVNSHAATGRNSSSKSLGRSYSGKKGREEPITPRSNDSGIVG